MKGLKSQLKRKKKDSDTIAEPSNKMRQITVFAGDSFVSAVELAAEKMGLSKSNFVRLAVAKAVRDAGVDIDDSMAVSYQGKQKAPKAVVEQRAASARAVKLWKQGLSKRHPADLAAAIAQTWDNAAEKVGRKLRVDELEQCEREIVELWKRVESDDGIGSGPPCFRK